MPSRLSANVSQPANQPSPSQPPSQALAAMNPALNPHAMLAQQIATLHCEYLGFTSRQSPLVQCSICIPCSLTRGNYFTIHVIWTGILPSVLRILLLALTQNIIVSEDDGTYVGHDHRRQ
jgi:hypothetical protein